MSSVEALSSSETSGAVAGASVPLTAGTVVAGFTPTVACIREQNSLEILETTSDTTADTPPPSQAAKPKSTVPDVVYDEHGQTWDVYNRSRSSSSSSSSSDCVAADACSTTNNHGQTWDVYGAEFDPLILGQAIQSYLEKIMARKIQAAAADCQRRPSVEKLTVEETGSKDDLDDQGRASGSRDGSRPRHRERALSFVMRYLCSSLWRPGRTSR